jgi:F-box/TPR repeat protein Pof3
MLTHAIFVNISLPAVDKALLYLSRCPNLEYLDLQMPCKGERIYELFKTSKSLRTLIVSEDIPLSQRRLTGFLADLPALERIESQRIKLSPAGSAVWPAEMPNLKAIALSSWDVSRSADQTPSLHIGDNCDVGCLNLFLQGIRVLIKPLQETLSKSIPNLEELSLHWKSSYLHRYPFSLTAAGLPKLRRLHLTHMDVTPGMVFPPTLEYLRFDGCTLSPFFDKDPPLKLPNLHSLIIEASYLVDLYPLRTLLSYTSEEALRYLHVDSDVAEDPILETVIEATATKGLREFSVAYMSDFTDSHVRTILNSMPELKVLRAPYTDVTDCSIRAIVEARLASLEEIEGGNPDSSQKRRPNIELVDIRFCNNLSSDAVVYGRARGIEIIEYVGTPQCHT